MEYVVRREACWNGKEKLEGRHKGFDMLKMHSIYMSENFKKLF